MAYWFTTQDPKVLNYGEHGHGVWVGERFRNSGDALRSNDEVAIYEVSRAKDRNNKEVGAKAVVAIIRVETIINPPEGPDKDGFLKIAKARLIASDEKGIPSKQLLKILKGINVQGKSVGSHLRGYAARVTVIDPVIFARINEHFTEYEPDDNYQIEVEKASPQVPSERIQKPKYNEQRGHRKLITHPELAAYCLAQAGYTCEANANHTTFTSKASGNNYLEAHHLVPLKHQPDFEFALDNPANIVALCPNCHRLLHHATVDEKQSCLRQLLTEERVRSLGERRIDVTVDDISGYY